MSDGEASDAVESKTVVYDSHRSDERQRDVALQRKLDELKQFERETEELERIEKEVLEDQKLLQRLATERLETDETRRQRRFEKVLLRQHTAALIRRSRQVQTEITTDLAWIDRLLAFEGEEEGKAEGEGPRSRINVVKEMLEEDLRHEARQERDMDDMLASEAAELAKRREQEWKCQEEARERLLNEVLSMCQDRVDSRLQALKQMKLARAERHEALKREINAAELQWKPPLQMEQSNGKDCDKLVKTEEANSRSSHAEAVFEEALRKEAEKLNISVDELKKVASGMGFSKAPFTGNQHKTQLIGGDIAAADGCAAAETVKASALETLEGAFAHLFRMHIHTHRMHAAQARRPLARPCSAYVHALCKGGGRAGMWRVRGVRISAQIKHLSCSLLSFDTYPSPLPPPPHAQLWRTIVLEAVFGVCWSPPTEITTMAMSTTLLSLNWRAARAWAAVCVLRSRTVIACHQQLGEEGLLRDFLPTPTTSQVNGEDVQNCSHEEAMEVFQRAPDPVIVVEVMRRPQPSSTTSPSVFPTPLVGGGGGLCSSGSGPGGAGDSNSELSSVLSTRRGVGGGGGVCSSSGATRSVAVQTVFSAGEMAASLAIAAASFAQQEARMALLGESASYGMPGKYPADYLLGVSGAGDGVEDEDGLEEEDEEEGNAEDVDDAVFGVDEVGCLNYILKQYPCSTNGVLPSFCHPHVFAQPIDSVYANFPENPASSSSASGNLPTGEYVTEKCFEVILQKQSASDKFGLTLCYRPSEVQQNFTEVYISE
uniref:Uncharacterized protein n=1 Tax=Echinococcus canadensis TaxID=519352 RepID=A0A915EZ39_9CEST